MVANSLPANIAKFLENEFKSRCLFIDAFKKIFLFSDLIIIKFQILSASFGTFGAHVIVLTDGEENRCPCVEDVKEDACKEVSKLCACVNKKIEYANFFNVIKQRVVCSSTIFCLRPNQAGSRTREQGYIGKSGNRAKKQVKTTKNFLQPRSSFQTN